MAVWAPFARDAGTIQFRLRLDSLVSVTEPKILVVAAARPQQRHADVDLIAFCLLDLIAQFGRAARLNHPVDAALRDVAGQPAVRNPRFP